MVDRCVHDAHRITDSVTIASRWCSRSLAPIVWFLLSPPMGPRDDGFALITTPLRDASAVLFKADEEEAVVALSQGAPLSSEADAADGPVSSDPSPQKNEKLGIDMTGNGNTGFFLGSGLSPNENPETAQEAGGALAAANTEKEDLHANVGEQGSSDRFWQVIGPPVLKLTSRLHDARGVEKEHEPGSSLRRPTSWQWPQDSLESSACSCIQECPRTCSAVSLCLGSRRSIPVMSSFAESETLSQGSEGNRSSVDLIHSKILDLVFPQNGGIPLRRM